nr:reverse transcriptase domain-containing protein [Tanacetum cinerariifolium]
MARMDAMTMKMDAQYKEFQSRSKQPNLDDDGILMSRKEEAKFMQTFCRAHFYNDYRDPKNMLVEVGKFTFPIDFVILEMEKDSKVLLILGRPFIHTADAVIRVNQNIDVIDKILQKDFDALMDEDSEILHSIKGTILEEKLFAEFDEFMAMTIDENSKSKSNTEEPPFEKITFNTDYKIKTSLEEPLTDLELKPFPDNLEFVFLEELSFLLVIISS